MKVTYEYLHQRFLAGLERRVAELSQLAGAGDFASLYRAFHSLAGIGGTYGHGDITHAAREGEQHSQDHDLYGVRGAIQHLEQIRDRLCRRDVAA